MLTCFETSGSGIPVRFFCQETFAEQKMAAVARRWLNATGYEGKPGTFTLVPDEKGNVAEVWCSISPGPDAFWQAGQLPFGLPAGSYQLCFDALTPASGEADMFRFVLAFALGSYRFTRYRETLRSPACLVLNSQLAEAVSRQAEAIFRVRDLINTPAEDMGPAELHAEIVRFADTFQAEVSATVGDALLEKGFHAIHAVGRASDDPPRLLDLRWGAPHHSKLTLVGKGVCFDSGGLDLKSAPSMLLMKKDMAGVALVLGLAQLIITHQLPLRLRVLMPLAENAVGGNAFRPGDVIRMHAGKTVEVGNTDAEGRLLLADALHAGGEEQPDLMVDLSTLTGAARVAVGTEISAFFCDDDRLAASLLQHGVQTADPLWRLPLHASYRRQLDSPIADLGNISADGYAGAIIAGLFLREFVPVGVPWVHFDMMAWNIRERPGRPAGGEAMAVRALFSYLCEWSGVMAVHH